MFCPAKPYQRTDHHEFKTECQTVGNHPSRVWHRLRTLHSCRFLWVYFVSSLGCHKSGFPGDVLNGFAITNTLADIARVCMMVTAVVSYPINHFPGRSAAFNLLFPGRNNSTLPLSYFRMHALLWTASAALIAYAIPKIEVVFGVMGATVASSVMFIIPGFLVLKDKYMQDNGLKIDNDGVINYSQLEGLKMKPRATM